MKLSDIFKKKIKKQKKTEVKEIETIAEKKPVHNAPAPTSKMLADAGGEAPKRETVKRKKSVATVYNIVSEPHISEKSMGLNEINQYIFDVFPKANKVQIKEAIEIIYGVDVLSVNIINIAPKKRRLGKIQGFKKGYKKAIVKVKAGQKIEIL